jgi:hypothetical protein
MAQALAFFRKDSTMRFRGLVFAALAVVACVLMVLPSSAGKGAYLTSWVSIGVDSTVIGSLADSTGYTSAIFPLHQDGFRAENVNVIIELDSARGGASTSLVKYQVFQKAYPSAASGTALAHGVLGTETAGSVSGQIVIASGATPSATGVSRTLNPLITAMGKKPLTASFIYVVIKNTGTSYDGGGLRVSLEMW